MKIIIEQTRIDDDSNARYRQIRVELEHPSDHLTGLDFVACLVRPAMKALGYHEDTINKALGVDES